ncbi:MAG: flagellar hook-basal body complex protein [Telluria sp.]
MFDSISIGTTGLLNHAKGLRVVGNNLANVNTSGFKSSQLQFASLFEQGNGSGQLSSGGNGSGTGSGLTSIGTQVSFRAGLDQTTGNPLDLKINGNGFFAVKRDDQLLYTRAGDFRFDDKGFLVNAAGDRVQAMANGQLSDITLDNLNRSAPKATSSVVFSGNVSNTVLTPPVSTGISGVTVLDANGMNHPLKLSLANAGGGAFTVTITDEANATVGTGTIKYAAGAPLAGADAITFSYAPAGAAAVEIKLDFSKTESTAGTSSMAMASQDGYAAGVKTDQTIEADGTLKIQYSNGQTAKGPRLVLADFRSDDAFEEAGGSAFRKSATAEVQYGHAGSESFGKLVAGHREGSNVDLAEEFGNLILMQRGYQAASHVVSTANDMIQQLFDMKGR